MTFQKGESLIKEDEYLAKGPFGKLRNRFGRVVILEE
jgi:hypothetical protein